MPLPPPHRSVCMCPVHSKNPRRTGTLLHNDLLRRCQHLPKHNILGSEVPDARRVRSGSGCYGESKVIWMPDP